MKKITTAGLVRFNAIMALVHLIQGIAILLLSRDFTLPVTGTYLQFNPVSQSLEPTTVQLFSVSVPLLVASFFFMSALAHFSLATICRTWYARNLANGINKARWFEYAVSASVMMVAIALLVGVYDAMSLVMLFALVAIMNLLGLAMEIYNQKAKTVRWLNYWIGCLAGIVPWVVIAFYFWLSADHDSAPPEFVYWIFVSIFVFFNLFAINMVLQYKRIGPWRDYLYGERAYIVLSLVAKTLLAWQVFAGTLRPL